MTITTLSSRDFNQRASEAKKAAEHGPVFITDRGRTAHVLLSFEEYQRILGAKHSLANLLFMPSVADSDFPLQVTRDVARAAEF